MYELFLTTLRTTSVLEELTNVSLSSERGPSIVIGRSAILVRNLYNQFVLPASMTFGLDALMMHNPSSPDYVEVTDYSQYNDRLSVLAIVSGLLLAIPTDKFDDYIYQDGSYVYEMYLTPLDAKTYRDLVVAYSSVTPSPTLDISFSLAEIGPWSTTLRSLRLVDMFYMKLTVTGMSSLTEPVTLPMNSVQLQCTVCE